MTTRTLRVLAAILALALAAAPAAARDICVSAGSFALVFKGVKKLKPGGAVPLQGIVLLPPSGVAPLHGSAIMDSSGDVELGITAYGMLDGISNVMMQAAVDAAFNGSAALDSNGDFTADGPPVTFTAVDCKTLVIP